MANLWKKYTPIDITKSLPRQQTAKYKTRDLSQCNRIVLHTTDWDTSPERLAEYDIKPNHISSRGCPAITYHDLIMEDGTVYHALDYEEVSWHVGIWNPGSIAVALMYKCVKDGIDQLSPTTEALRSLFNHVGDLCLALKIPPTEVVGHRELLHTGFDWKEGSKILRKTCPGMRIDLDLVRKVISQYVQVRLKEQELYKGPLDGIFGKKSKQGFYQYVDIKNVV